MRKGAFEQDRMRETIGNEKFTITPINIQEISKNTESLPLAPTPSGSQGGGGPEGATSKSKQTAPRLSRCPTRGTKKPQRKRKRYIFFSRHISSRQNDIDTPCRSGTPSDVRFYNERRRSVFQHPFPPRVDLRLTPKHLFFGDLPP